MTNASDIDAILRLATEQNLVLTCAESCTGGLVAAALTHAPGSSKMFEFGFVTYSNVAKIKLLNVAPSTVDTFGAVSEPTVREMALGALAQSGADISVAISGIAGPGGSDHKPEGRVCFALARRQKHAPASVSAETKEFGACGRDKVRLRARDYALRLLRCELA